MIPVHVFLSNPQGPIRPSQSAASCFAVTYRRGAGSAPQTGPARKEPGSSPSTGKASKVPKPKREQQGARTCQDGTQARQSLRLIKPKVCGKYDSVLLACHICIALLLFQHRLPSKKIEPLSAPSPCHPHSPLSLLLEGALPFYLDCSQQIQPPPLFPIRDWIDPLTGNDPTWE